MLFFLSPLLVTSFFLIPSISLLLSPILCRNHVLLEDGAAGMSLLFFRFSLVLSFNCALVSSRSTRIQNIRFLPLPIGCCTFLPLSIIHVNNPILLCDCTRDICFFIFPWFLSFLFLPHLTCVLAVSPSRCDDFFRPLLDSGTMCVAPVLFAPH